MGHANIFLFFHPYCRHVHRECFLGRMGDNGLGQDFFVLSVECPQLKYSLGGGMSPDNVVEKWGSFGTKGINNNQPCPVVQNSEKASCTKRTL